MNKTWMIYGLLFLAGVVAANKARTLPLLNRLPSI